MTIDTDEQVAARLRAASTRDRLLDAAQHVVETDGWSAITMSRIAAITGVSRQTVYNELGTRRTLAHALVMRELERFLDTVRVRMRAEVDVVAAVESGCAGALELAEESRLVRMIIASSAGGSDSELLATLTTESGELVEIAAAVVKAEIVDLFPDQPFAAAELDTLGDIVVRLVLSAITRPAKPAAVMARDIAWIVKQAYDCCSR